MSVEPTSLDRAIVLSVAEALEPDTRKRWIKAVRQFAPTGVVTTMQMIDDEGVPQAIAMVAHETKKGFTYSVPLTRDLLEKEVDRIVEAFSTDQPELDFEISTTAIDQFIAPDERISVDQERHIEMCMAFAKTRHEDWVREQTKAGWRYGVRFSTSEKTHPLIRPWHELPDKFRKPDLSWPEKMIKMLSDQGYAVVSQDDLARALKLLKVSS